jgi:hypothetical protein
MEAFFFLFFSRSHKVLIKGDMLDYYDVSGCYILKPWSYTVWQQIQSEFFFSLNGNNALLELSSPTETSMSPSNTRLVRRRDQEAWRGRLLLSDVCVFCPVGEGKGPHRGVRARSRLGHQGVSRLVSSFCGVLNGT